MENPQPKRKHPHLKEYDYSQNGCYFVTICTFERQQLFDTYSVGRDLCVPPTAATQIAVKWMKELEIKYPTCRIEKAVIMPNHIHMIVALGTGDAAAHTGAALPRIMQWYKTMTTNAYIRGVKSGILLPFRKTLWQTSFYDHVIRNEADYLRIWQYIDTNPAKWVEDEYYTI